MKGYAAPFLAAVLLLSLVPGSACGSDAPEVAATIRAFEPAEGFVRTGEPATASVRVENTGTRTATFFLGYSVRDAAGRWHDAPPLPVELGSGEESGPLATRPPPLRTPGYYDSRVSVWSGEPSSQGSRRIADRTAASTFRVAGEREDFYASALDPTRWIEH